MTRTALPFSPRSATELRLGDLIAVPSSSGHWTCLQVVELKPRVRSNFVIGIVPWCGDHPPQPDDVTGLAPTERALSRIELFTEGGLQVVGNADMNDNGQERWYAPGYVGKRTRVWGWATTIRRANATCIHGG